MFYENFISITTINSNLSTNRQYNKDKKQRWYTSDTYTDGLCETDDNVTSLVAPLSHDVSAQYNITQSTDWAV